MKPFLLFALLFINLSCIDNTQVYICDSKTAKKYHLKANCRGLRNCTHKVIKVTIDEAQKRGKTLCGWEK